MEAQIPSYSLERLETLTEQLEEKLEESWGNTRDAIIATELHTWAHLEVRGEFIAIGVRVNMCKDP